MVLALRSGIDSEIAWALDRISRRFKNDAYHLSIILGLVDALFERPEWFLQEYTNSNKKLDESLSLFSAPPTARRHRRFALESISIIRNASFQEANATLLASMPRARTLVLEAVDKTDAFGDFFG